MERRIWKYSLLIVDRQTLKLPKKAEILSVFNQNDILVLYAMLDETQELESRTIEIVGTGNPVPVDMGIDRKFIGSVQQGRFVWHVFELV